MRLYFVNLWRAICNRSNVAPGLVLVPQEAYDVLIARVAKSERRAAGQRNRRKTFSGVPVAGPQEISQ